MFAALFRALLLRRLFEYAARRSHRSRHRYGHGYGYGRHGRGRGRTSWIGPFPAYSRRTRGGGRVTVTGCCLPIPLGVFVLGALGLSRAVRASGG